MSPVSRQQRRRADRLCAEGQDNHRAGRLADAIACYRRALEILPHHAEALHSLGVAAHQTGQHTNAVALIGQAIAEDNGNPLYFINLASALRAIGNVDGATAAYQRAITLRPDRGEYHSDLGTLLMANGQVTGAAAEFGAAIIVNPTLSKPYYNLGLAFLHLKNVELAASAFWRAMAVQPDYASAWVELGRIHQMRGEFDAAIAAFRKAIALQPDHPEARLSLTFSFLPVVEESLEHGQAAIKAFADALDDLAAWGKQHRRALGKVIGNTQPFYLAYRHGDVTDLMSRYGDIACQAAKAYWQNGRNFAGSAAISHRPLRLAIVSAHIRQSSVWSVVLKGILRHLDREQFELYLYYTETAVDEETSWAANQAQVFVQGKKPPAAWLAQISADRPDILFYPEVGMDPVSGLLATLRLAPLQVAAWGHPVTTGLSTIDLFLSGDLLEGPDADQHSREKLVRLPGTGACMESTFATPVDVDMEKLGLLADRKIVRFTVCQIPAKCDPLYDDLFSRIAQVAGPCQFIFPRDRNNPWATDSLLRRLEKTFYEAELDPTTYLRVVPWFESQGEFLGFLDQMDVYLDCPAFSGYTTAWQAVHRGLPIVTLAGKFLRQRLAAGLLRKIGQIETIANNSNEYVAIAGRLADECRNPAARLARRSMIQTACPRSENNVDVVRALEFCLRH